MKTDDIAAPSAQAASSLNSDSPSTTTSTVGESKKSQEVRESDKEEPEKEDEFLVQLMHSIITAFFLALAYRIFKFVRNYLYGPVGDEEL